MFPLKVLEPDFCSFHEIYSIFYIFYGQCECSFFPRWYVRFNAIFLIIVGIMVWKTEKFTLNITFCIYLNSKKKRKTEIYTICVGDGSTFLFLIVRKMTE